MVNFLHLGTRCSCIVTLVADHQGCARAEQGSGQQLDLSLSSHCHSHKGRAGRAVQAAHDAHGAATQLCSLATAAGERVVVAHVLMCGV
jgi:hypothetical protein